MFPSRFEQNQLKANISASYNKLYGQFSLNELQEVGNYKILKIVGEGSFGKVYLASHRLTHQKVVLKMGSKNDPNVVREVFYHRQFDYSHITKLYEVIVTENYVWMALEYCPGKELYEYLLAKKHIPLEECSELFSQIVGAVYYAHSMKCVHRDLKLENILLDKKGHAKLTDFGFTRECATKGILETICGTTVYMAPELIERKPYEGYKIDTWSLGIILYTMIHGTMPFDEVDEVKTKYKIVHYNPTYDNDYIDSNGKELISQLLEKDPNQRPSLTQVLQHPFLQPYGLKILERTEKVIRAQSHGTKHFHSKLERKLLKKLKNSGFDTQAIKQSVNKKKCDALAGMWQLLLEKEKKCESLRHPKRSRSVLSVKKVFEPSAPSRKASEDFKLSDGAGKASSLKRIMSKKSDTISIRQPINAVPINSNNVDEAQSNTSGRPNRRPNLFNKMTNFFKTKKQSGNNCNSGPTSPNTKFLDKRKRNTNSFDSKKISPGRSPFSSTNEHDQPNGTTPAAQEKLKIQEPMLKKFKSNTSSEVSHQTSLGNYDSEVDHRPLTNGPATSDESKSVILKGRPNSILSQQSEFSNDTYNSEYSTDGNVSYSKANSSLSSTNRNISSVIMSPNGEGNENASTQSRVATRRSMSIMSSASSASERSSRTDSFYDISTASSPKTMDLRAMGNYTSADTIVPRMTLGSHWLSKRGRSPVARRGRPPKRNISRKLMNHTSSAAQSVIQEESSFDDEEDNAGGLLEESDVHQLVSPSDMAGSQTDIPSTDIPDIPSKPGTPVDVNLPQGDYRPALFTMSRSYSGSSPWSHNYSEERLSISDLTRRQNSEDHSEFGSADNEDNSIDD